MNLRG